MGAITVSAHVVTSVTVGQPSLKTIIFGGELGRRFGRVHKYACDTPAEALRALCMLIEGLENFLRTSPLQYKLFVDKRGVRDAEHELHTCHGAQQYAVMPVLTGSKSAGLTQMVVGAILIALAFVPGLQFASTYLISAGIGMMVGGAVTMLMGTRTPQIEETESNDNPSYYTNGATNTTAPGQCVPVGYGEMIVGSALVSVDITTVDIAVN